MSDANLQQHLLADALEQLSLNPTDVQRWRALLDARNADPQPALDAELVAAVRARLPADGVAGFLRAGMLGALTRGAACYDEAGAVLLACVPVDVERIMAFATLLWVIGVYGTLDNVRWTAFLRAASLPALLRLAGDELTGTARPLGAPRRVDMVRRIAVVAPTLAGPNHPPSKMALQQACLLREAGYEVALFACQETEQPHLRHYLVVDPQVGSAITDARALQAHLPGGMSATLSDTRWSLMARWRGMLDTLGSFDPDLVMFVGLQSPLMFPLHAARPVLAMNVHAFAPLVPADAWLCADAAAAGRVGCPWGDALGPASAHHHPFRVQAPAPAAIPLTRAELGLAPHELLVISVGGRLADEISASWAARMQAVLARHPRAVWLLAGGDGVLPPALAHADPARVRVLAHTDRLASLLPSCDVYANPPRMGGGLSAGEAMAAGLPVLALAGGDAGSKLGELAQADDDAYFSQLERLLVDVAARAQLGARMRERFDSTLDLAHSHASLRAACALALARFKERMA